MNNCFILLAAGKGKRFNSREKKQFINYKNKPLFMHSIDKAKDLIQINTSSLFSIKIKRFLNILWIKQ